MPPLLDEAGQLGPSALGSARSPYSRNAKNDLTRHHTIMIPLSTTEPNEQPKSHEVNRHAGEHEGLQAAHETDDEPQSYADEDRGEGVEGGDAGGGFDGFVKRDDEDRVCGAGRGGKGQLWCPAKRGAGLTHRGSRLADTRSS